MRYRRGYGFPPTPFIFEHPDYDPLLCPDNVIPLRIAAAVRICQIARHISAVDVCGNVVPAIVNGPQKCETIVISVPTLNRP